MGIRTQSSGIVACQGRSVRYRERLIPLVAHSMSRRERGRRQHGHGASIVRRYNGRRRSRVAIKGIRPPLGPILCRLGHGVCGMGVWAYGRMSRDGSVVIHFLGGEFEDSMQRDTERGNGGWGQQEVGKNGGGHWSSNVLIWGKSM